MVLAEQTGEIVVSGALGDLDVPAHHALLDRQLFTSEGVRLERMLSLKTDPWLEDHRIDGIAVLPGAIGLELMDAVALAAEPESKYYGAQIVTFHTPVKLYRDQQLLIWVEAKEIQEGLYHCELYSGRNLIGDKHKETLHFTAEILLSEIESPNDLPFFLGADAPFKKENIYQHYFHGPQFQVLNDIRQITKEALQATGYLPEFPVPLYSGPLLIEAAFQAAGFHYMSIFEQSVLPAGFLWRTLSIADPPIRIVGLGKEQTL